MGGDFGPEVVISGAEISLGRHPDIRYLLFGDEARIAPALERNPKVAARSQVIHTDVAVAMHDKPSQALRKGRRTSSMWLALQAIKDGQAATAVSAGNTGALMAMAKICLKTMPGIERPAIAAIWPTLDGDCVVLDVGANVGASARQLADFALMGASMARALFGLPSPKVGLLNIGVEEIKGVEAIKQAHAWLRSADLPLTYTGFVEGNQIGQGVVHVVVTEGFSGNIALKSAEGTARQLIEFLRATISRSWRARIGYLLAKHAFDALKGKMDPRQLNGGVFLGLNGIVIKSHGGADAMGFASAIDLGYDMARSGRIARLSAELEHFHELLDEPIDEPLAAASEH